MGRVFCLLIEQYQPRHSTEKYHVDGIDFHYLDPIERSNKEKTADAELPEIFFGSAEVLART